MTGREFRERRWTRVEYDRLIDTGVFEPGEPIELLGGLLVVAESQGGTDFIALDAESEPEPDVAVVPGTARDYRAGHPTHAVLVVEVAESSLRRDREDKGSLYARAGIADYWIVNLVDRVLEVVREPGPEPAAPFGWRYQCG